MTLTAFPLANSIGEENASIALRWMSDHLKQVALLESSMGNEDGATALVKAAFNLVGGPDDE